MTTRRGLAVWALLAVVLFGVGTSCAPFRSSWQPPRPVKIEAIEGKAAKYFNLFPSWFIWQSSATEGKPACMLARDGDLIGVHGNWNGGYFIYQASDGPVLKPTFEEARMLLAGKVVSLSLEKDGAAWEWLEKASTQELAGVRFISLPKDLDAVRLPTLKKLADASPNVGLAVNTKQPAFSQVLSLLKPRVLFLAGPVLSAEERRILAGQKQLDTVVWQEPGSLDFLAKLPNLRRLAISNYDVEKSGPLPKGLKSLKSLLISGKMEDVSWLVNAPAGLEEVSLIMCEELSDVSGLAKLPGLKTVILNGSEKVLDLSSLASLKKLQWMGLPPNISQEQFTAFVKAHPDLKFLEMIQCENETDLSPLRDLKRLEGLILAGGYKNLDVVQGLKSLRFVGISDETFSKSPDQVAAIQEALPDALVIPVSLCLGSGWILVLFPAVALLWFLRSRRWCRSTGGQKHA